MRVRLLWPHWATRAQLRLSLYRCRPSAHWRTTCGRSLLARSCYDTKQTDPTGLPSCKPPNSSTCHCQSVCTRWNCYGIHSPRARRRKTSYPTGIKRSSLLGLKTCVLVQTQVPALTKPKKISRSASKQRSAKTWKSGFVVEVAKSAEDDLLAGYWFYEAQQVGIGNYFLNSLCADIHSLTVFAGIHAKAYRGIYRTFSARFPFGIYYVIDGRLVTVVAVLDTRRNPRTIRSRISDEDYSRR